MPAFDCIEDDDTVKPHQALAIGLVLLSMLLTALVSRSVFERMPHLEDEVTYLWQARAIAGGQPVLQAPTPSRPFWQPFVVVQGENRFGKYSLGWPGLLSVGVLLGQTWVVNAFLAGVTVALVYRLGREIFWTDVGLIAAALTTFSPMALLLNGTLMGHTAALATGMLFVYAYWRLSRGGRRALWWGLLAGVGLGLTAINRPLAGGALAGPFIAWSGVRLLRACLTPASIGVHSDAVSIQKDTVENLSSQAPLPESKRNAVRQTLGPLLALAGVTLLIGLIIPAYNYAATGDARKNLYLLVWPYDRVGFGEGYGRNGHTLEKGLRQTRWDLSLTAADLFGWQIGSFDEEARQHILLEADYWPNLGLSWLLLPFGLIIGLKRRWTWWAVWLLVGAAIFMGTTNLPVETLRDRDFALLWLGAAALWLLIPFAFFVRGKLDEQQAWTWLLLAIPLSLIGLHITYWIGSQRYSTRYYYEGLAALALLSALPLGWLSKRRLAAHWLLYPLLAAVLVYSLVSYSVPRIQPLYRFNWVSPELIEAVNARRTTDAPVLVIVQGTDVRWRSFGSLMVVTSPFLDSDIVAAWDNGGEGQREAILALFPDREVIEMTAMGNLSCFGDTLEGECYGEGAAG
jgi:hypothetical protein